MLRLHREITNGFNGTTRLAHFPIRRVPIANICRRSGKFRQAHEIISTGEIQVADYILNLDQAMAERFFGIGVDKHLKDITKVTALFDLDTSQIAAVTRNKVARSLGTGVMDARSGKAATLFTMMSMAYGLPFVLVQRSPNHYYGKRWYASFNSDSFVENLEAANSLVPKTSRNPRPLDFSHSKVCNGLGVWGYGLFLTLNQVIYAFKQHVDTDTDKQIRAKARKAWESNPTITCKVEM